MTGPRFGTISRLTKRKDFERVITKGRKIVGKELLLWSLKQNSETSPTRMGTSISRKLGGAVRRNRIKRLLREAFRLNRGRMVTGYELVAYPRPGCGWDSLKDAEESLLSLCRKGGILRDIQ